MDNLTKTKILPRKKPVDDGDESDEFLRSLTQKHIVETDTKAKKVEAAMKKQVSFGARDLSTPRSA